MTSGKTQELLDSLKGIVKKPRKKEPLNVVVSNQYGEDAKGKPLYIDRLYGDLYGSIKLVNKNFTEYKGKINKRSISVKGLDGNNFLDLMFMKQTMVDGLIEQVCQLKNQNKKQWSRKNP